MYRFENLCERNDDEFRLVKISAVKRKKTPSKCGGSETSCILIFRYLLHHREQGVPKRDSSLTFQRQDRDRLYNDKYERVRLEEPVFEIARSLSIKIAAKK